MVTEGCSESRMRSGHDEELRNGPEVKINILDEGYWSSELFRGYRVTTNVSERGFRGPDKRWGGLMGQGERAHQPTKGLSAPPTPSHITRRGRAPPLGQPPLPAWGQVS